MPRSCNYILEKIIHTKTWYLIKEKLHEETLRSTCLYLFVEHLVEIRVWSLLLFRGYQFCTYEKNWCPSFERLSFLSIVFFQLFGEDEMQLPEQDTYKFLDVICKNNRINGGQKFRVSMDKMFLKISKIAKNLTLIAENLSAHKFVQRIPSPLKLLFFNVRDNPNTMWETFTTSL